MSDRDDGGRPRIGRNVVVLGLVSLLTDTSSEMLYPVVPLFLTEVVRAPMGVVGLIEGLAESAAALLKLVSGRWSDRTPRRLPFLVAGYGLAGAARPLLALATAWPAVLAARVVDRVGKGLRGPPRDAIIAASTDAAVRGRAFGIHRGLDTVGAVLGPAIALGAMSAGVAYRSIFWLALAPMVLAVALLALVRERATPRTKAAAIRVPLSPTLRRFLWVTAVFSFGNSSNAFLLLRARDLGWSATGVVGLYILYNIVYAAAAVPLGSLSDRVGRRRVLQAGLAVFALVYAGFALAPGAWAAPLLLLAYGLYAAAFGGAARAYVADLAQREGVGGAMGAYHAVTGAMLLVASGIAGLLWARFGAAAPFALGAATALVALAMLAAAIPDDPSAGRTPAALRA